MPLPASLPYLSTEIAVDTGRPCNAAGPDRYLANVDKVTGQSCKASGACHRSSQSHRTFLQRSRILQLLEQGHCSNAPRLATVVRNTERYIMMGDLWPAETYAPANGELITEQNLKSSLALPWPAHLSPGAHIITGFARAPSTPINKVEWSDDNGEHWSEAQLVGPNEKYGWTRFQFEWVASPGHQALMTRATDSDGNIQPETIPFNNGGYMFNAIHPHPIIVE